MWFIIKSLLYALQGRFWPLRAFTLHLLNLYIGSIGPILYELLLVPGISSSSCHRAGIILWIGVYCIEAGTWYAIWCVSLSEIFGKHLTSIELKLKLRHWLIVLVAGVVLYLLIRIFVWFASFGLKPDASRPFASSSPKRRFGVADTIDGCPIAASTLTLLRLLFVILLDRFIHIRGIINRLLILLYNARFWILYQSLSVSIHSFLDFRIQPQGILDSQAFGLIRIRQRFRVKRSFSATWLNWFPIIFGGNTLSIFAIHRLPWIQRWGIRFMVTNLASFIECHGCRLRLSGKPRSLRSNMLPWRRKILLIHFI